MELEALKIELLNSSMALRDSAMQLASRTVILANPAETLTPADLPHLEDGLDQIIGKAESLKALVTANREALVVEAPPAPPDDPEALEEAIPEESYVEIAKRLQSEVKVDAGLAKREIPDGLTLDPRFPAPPVESEEPTPEEDAVKLAAETGMDEIRCRDALKLTNGNFAAAKELLEKFKTQAAIGVTPPEAPKAPQPPKVPIPLFR